MPYSLLSTGKPKSSFACTVSRPLSCKLYALSLCPNPIPRPSCPRKYTIAPLPSFAIFFIAISNWLPQSHRALLNISPVKHSECTRTNAFSFKLSAISSTVEWSPYTNATCSIPSTFETYETAVKDPCSVGTLAMAVRSINEFFSVALRYRIISEIKTIFKSCFLANSFSSGNLLMLPVPSSLTISHKTPTGALPAILDKSTAASVWPALFITPPSRYRSGNTCPGLTKSVGFVASFARALIVAALSPADIPVVLVVMSQLTVNAVFM
mmetsp:Transcript_2449/g.7489  ORF Transcript_2449/g.7489 Transcript_2449/m.7489 type:complete len:268 (-) Transcript_2449:641-1444(-)